MYEEHAPFATSAAAPYPPVAAREKNPFYAALLLEDFAAPAGELTAIHQYLYQSWLLAPRYPEAARALRNAARVEMLHLDMLGRLVALLGCAPKYGVAENGRRRYWAAETLSYATDPVAMLEGDIFLEESVIRAYGAHAAEIQDARVQTLLQRLILDERVHLELFGRLRNALCRRGET